MIHVVRLRMKKLILSAIDYLLICGLIFVRRVSPYVCSYKFWFGLVAEWPPLGKELFIRSIIFSLCILTICNFSYFAFWF